jgi:hypothetical protein
MTDKQTDSTEDVDAKAATDATVEAAAETAPAEESNEPKLTELEKAQAEAAEMKSRYLALGRRYGELPQTHHAREAGHPTQRCCECSRIVAAGVG